ncbi:MAG TPA: bifunctional pyr operon transcriptional regulator/uracil phosphoribosyltransferase PyrR [Acidimicrobiia bacterium]|nr:bifunctional pyr operon transcriptional regulator/uracil phosphoribosyltransferase PyrR [Acidimicrobiia bacterium]
MRRVCTRISHEIIERNNGAHDLVLLGLVRRGALIASRISRNISEIENTEVPVFSLDITDLRDDRENLESSEVKNYKIDDIASITPDIAPKFPPLLSSESNQDFSKSHIVLVDDVLFTGRSIRAAMDSISRISRPSRVQLAVLIDRGHRELPIRADFIGKNLPTKSSERVNVLMEEIDGIDRVDVERAKLP